MSKTPRRRGAETSETRARLLDMTEKIMLADGFAAVSSRRIAKETGVTAALVHYYFGTLDNLFLAVLKRRADQQLERQRRARKIGLTSGGQMRLTGYGFQWTPTGEG